MKFNRRNVLKESELYKIDGLFRAANYLSVGQLYLLDNPLLKEKLIPEHIKNKLVGHWGTVPGQNFIITHLNRIIKMNKLNMMLVVGPGHGGNAAVANCYLEGTYSKYYEKITEDAEGMKKLFKQFSFPGGISSHVAPETPGSINEGGELGYSLAHAFGAALDNPNLIVACILGDGESETGPLAASLHLNKILNPKTDGLVLPILHLNGYKISNPTVLSRIPRSELKNYLEGAGWRPYFVDADKLPESHQKMAAAMDEALLDLKSIKKVASMTDNYKRPLYPMIVLTSPKGWTGPKIVDNKQIEGTFRAHQIPLTLGNNNENLLYIENWLKSYNPDELFDETGKLKEKFRYFIPEKKYRLFDNANANGGSRLKDLKLPDISNYAVEETRGQVQKQDMTVLAHYIKDILKMNSRAKNVRGFSPDETLSNRMSPLFEQTNRQFNAVRIVGDEFLSDNGAIIDSILSEHICEGLLEGYILTGRHGFFSTYEAFARVVDSMISQHAKWLKVCGELPWREDISSLNLILTSHCWQQDHNGYTHQDPGLLNHLITKKSDIVRMYLPADANSLLSVFEEMIKSRNKVNAVVASKHPSYQWLSIKEAQRHFKLGIGEWSWASTCDKTDEPDLVMACAGDVPTLETLAAVSLLHEYIPRLKIRVINVIDLMKLLPNSEYADGLSDKKYDELFTTNKPILFAFHGYPSLIKEMIFNRTNRNVSVHGYNEEGTITTAFDMRVQNELDRYHLVLDVIKSVPNLGSEAEILKRYCDTMLKKHNKYIREFGIDMPEISDWKWKKIK